MARETKEKIFEIGLRRRATVQTETFEPIARNLSRKRRATPQRGCGKNLSSVGFPETCFGSALRAVEFHDASVESNNSSGGIPRLSRSRHASSGGIQIASGGTPDASVDAEILPGDSQTFPWTPRLFRGNSRRFRGRPASSGGTPDVSVDAPLLPGEPPTPP